MLNEGLCRALVQNPGLAERESDNASLLGCKTGFAERKTDIESLRPDVARGDKPGE